MSTDESEYTVYTLEFCPRCEILKEYLASCNIPYNIRDLSSAEALTDLRINGIFVQEAPVLQYKEQYLTSKELFNGDELLTDAIFGLKVNSEGK